MSFDWAGFDRCVLDGDSAAATALLLAASEAERLARFGELTARVRSDPGTWWRRSRHFPRLHALAVIACAPSAARAAALLRHGDMADWNGMPIAEFRTIARARGLTWTADLGVRLAARIPADGLRPREWAFVTTLLAEGPADPPVTPGVVRSWARAAFDRPRDLTGTAHLGLLLPAVFETDGIGGSLLGSHFSTAVRRLADDGRFDRPALLAMTLDRLVRGDRPGHLRAFTAFHDDLAPSAGEIAAHALDYVRILGSSPPAAAGLAQRALRAADDAGLLSLEILLEAGAVALRRPEKSLVKAQLAALDRVARRDPSRAGDVLATVSVAFGHPVLDLQEQALALTGRHLRHVTDGAVVAGLAEAAGDLGGFLRPRAVSMFGSPPGSGAATPGPAEGVSPPPLPATVGAGFSLDITDSGVVAGIDRAAVVPDRAVTGPVVAGMPPGETAAEIPPSTGDADEMPPSTGGAAEISPSTGDADEMPLPIGSAAELAEELVALVEAQSAVRWERVLDGLVRLHAAGEAEALAATLRPVLHRHEAEFSRRDPDRLAFLGETIRAVAGHRPQPAVRRQLITVAGMAAGDHAIPADRDLGLLSVPDGILTLRLAELAVRIARDPVPYLFATPTHVTGTIDAEVLITRSARAEEQGWEPPTVDFEQALLRVTVHDDPEMTARAEALVSAHGRRLAAWLAAGGLPDPVGSRYEQTHVDGTGAILARRAVVNLRPGHPDPPPIRLATVVSTLQRTSTPYPDDYWFSHFNGEVLVQALPHHRETAAAWMLPRFADLGDQSGSDVSPLLPLLAEASGPAGTAMALALIYGLGARFPADRVAAVDAFLLLATAPASSAGRVGAEPGPFAEQADAEPGPFAGRVGAEPGPFAGQIGAAPGSFAGRVGAELGDLGSDGTVKVARVASALAEAHQAGASAAVWQVLRAALPLLLPTSPHGLPDLLELATQVAATVGASDDIPALTEVASRRGGSRLLREARRLDEILHRPAGAAQPGPVEPRTRDSDSVTPNGTSSPQPAHRIGR